MSARERGLQVLCTRLQNGRTALYVSRRRLSPAFCCSESTQGVPAARLSSVSSVPSCSDLQREQPCSASAASCSWLRAWFSSRRRADWPCRCVHGQPELVTSRAPRSAWHLASRCRPPSSCSTSAGLHLRSSRALAWLSGSEGVAIHCSRPCAGTVAPCAGVPHFTEPSPRAPVPPDVFLHTANGCPVRCGRRRHTCLSTAGKQLQRAYAQQARGPRLPTHQPGLQATTTRYLQSSAAAASEAVKPSETQPDKAETEHATGMEQYVPRHSALLITRPPYSVLVVAVSDVLAVSFFITSDPQSLRESPADCSVSLDERHRQETCA